MKPLYYLEFALSTDEFGNIIPARKLKWFTPDKLKLAFEDLNQCEIMRFRTQETLNDYIVRVKKAGLIKNIRIRTNYIDVVHPWVII